MKKFSLVTMISAALLFAGCGLQSGNNMGEDNQEKSDTEVVNNREIGRIDADVDIYEFQEAVTKSDLIAQIEIVGVLKEINEPSPKTIFRAKLIEGLKGSSNAKEIFVLQQGNSDYVFNDNPLFKKGENYLLFLMETTQDFEMEDSYWILGEETGMYKLLDQSTAVKLSVKEDELEQIEVSEEKIALSIEQIKLNMNEREMQVLKQNELKNLIKNLSKEKK